MSDVELLPTQGFDRVVKECALDQGRIALTDIRLGNQRFQVGSRHPGRHIAAVFIADGFVAQRQGYQVFQGQLRQRQGLDLGIARHNQGAPGLHAGNGDPYIVECCAGNLWVLSEHERMNGIQGEFIDGLDAIIKGFTRVLKVLGRHIHRVSPIG